MPNGWFRKRKPEMPPEVPEGLMTPCPKCKELLFTREWERNLKVCQKCGFHFPISARERVELLTDPGTFQEQDAGLVSTNPLNFPSYAETLERHGKATGLTDACLSGDGLLSGHPFSLAVTDRRFMMGSMGSVVGERITRSIERATERGTPVLLVSGTGGGARMHEGLLALMQMAKTSAALARHQDAGLLAVVLLTDPTMGGVTASWGSLGDLNLAEPGATIGFAGLRVAQQANVGKIPADFQTAEFHRAHGQIDRVVPRKELKETLARIFRFAGAPVETVAGETGESVNVG
ncbi:MAG: acetyl-CoA carboxylase, carboxyltransferase subunit beta [Armatimonadota bacterium]